ncbi:hypothetical protein SLS53_003254 [Cytospora paraplurivora]|uniref:Cytochrome P450 n=1 Tax=Cytospora paraplurivora TaxID=2898453 RepID=A0AAN9UIX0_9PEZI
MVFPWKPVTAASVTIAYLATSTLKQTWTISAFLRYFAGSWILGFACWAFWSVILYPKFFSPLIGLPEPENPSWLHGQWSKIRDLPTGVPMLEWVSTVPNDGLIRYLAMFNEERILVTSPKALAEVLVTKAYDFKKPGMVRHTIGRILGIGVLLAEGDEHRFQRKNLMPAFAFRHVKDLYPVFWDKAREGVQAMTEQILADAGKESSSSSPATTTTEKVGDSSSSSSSSGKTAVLEVSAWASRITLDIIGVAGLGRDFGAISDQTNSLFRTYNSLFQPSREARLLTTLGFVLPAWLVTRLPVRRNGDIREAAGLIRGVCFDLIREKKERLGRGEPAGADILSVALGSGGFTEANLVDQLMTFLAAGHETTASSMTWAVYLLARHPGVQRRLREEVRARLPPPGAAAVSSLDVDHLPYLSAVCSEVLRYYPPVPMTLREAAVDTTILGRRVPAGTRIVISPAATNKDPLLWGAEAAQFNPDRWLSRQQQQQHDDGEKVDRDGHRSAAAAGGGGASSNYAFLSFLHGPRSCIGMGFARAEFACLLAAWVGRMEFELRDKEELDERNMEIKGGVTQRPAKGLWVKATVLDGW